MMKFAALSLLLFVGTPTSFATDPICKAGDTLCGSICIRAGGAMECVDGACTPSKATADLISLGLSDLSGTTEDNCLVPENECGGVYCPEGQECDTNICVATPAPTPAPTPGVTCEDLNYCKDAVEACRKNNDAIGAECVTVADLCSGSKEEICTTDDVADYYYNAQDQGWQTPGLASTGVICVASGFIDGCSPSGSRSLMVGSLFGLITVLLVAVIEV
mmetsp:Transcript_23294/g.46410  ORF Transcript_23294/g.46410 Transcript_23294/m.46410 type:complete len:219 (+) Transcript_23294:86-742(+)